MSASLLDLPPELLIPTLALLPTDSLLKFSQCSRYARSLANSSLHTLDLEFGPRSYKNDCCLLTNSMPVEPSNYFYSPRRRSLSTKHTHHFHTPILDRRDNKASANNKMTYKKIVRVNDAQSYGYPTLVNFHSALLSSLLVRYRNALKNIDITLWEFTAPMAKAISELSALRSLSVRIQEPCYMRSPHDSSKVAQLTAWQILATSTAWAGRLLVLKINNSDIVESCLFKILENNARCRELSLKKCALIGRALWDFLSLNLKSRNALQTLVIADCGGVLNTITLEAIERLRGLQVSIYRPT
jgi:hypothetical protein